MPCWETLSRGDERRSLLQKLGQARFPIARRVTDHADLLMPRRSVPCFPREKIPRFRRLRANYFAVLGAQTTRNAMIVQIPVTFDARNDALQRGPCAIVFTELGGD